MKTKLARLETLSSEERTANFVMILNESKPDPMEDLNHSVRLLIWASTVFAIIVATILIVAALVVARQFHQEVQNNENLIVALCRQTNAHNRDLTVIALDLGIPAHVLAPFGPKPCTVSNLRKEFGR